MAVATEQLSNILSQAFLWITYGEYDESNDCVF